MTSRRQFIALLGGAVAAWPLASRAQQSSMPVIGFLRDTTAEGSEYLVAALSHGLREVGLAAGKDFHIEFGWGNGDRQVLPALATAFARKPVSVIVASATSATIAAKSATSTVPIVFAFPGDPVELLIVASLNRPGGNATGVSYLNTELAGKRLGILHELAPTVSLVGLLINSKGANAASTIQDIQKAAPAIGVQIEIVNATNESEIDRAFETVGGRAGALLIGNDSFFTTQRNRIAALALRHRLPAIYAQRENAESGGLMSYGANLPDAYRLAGTYAGRIIKGEKPAELPVLQPTKFELVINLRTAKIMKFQIPPKVLALADEVIE
jgi:ABC-type uncharacterized transport system substrate-binding protein